MSQDDPFHDSVRELRELTVRAKLVQHSVTQRGFVDSEKVVELGELCAYMEELVTLLEQMQHSVEERGGRLPSKIFSANEIMERQSTLRTLTADVAEASAFLRQLQARSAASAAAAASAARGEEAGGQPDRFFVAQELVQHEEAKQQDEVIDRLAFGLRELQETGININDELVQQDEMLTDMERDLSGVQVRLRAANAKVDKLLASMSNKGKVCTIVTLILILIFLSFFALR